MSASSNSEISFPPRDPKERLFELLFQHYQTPLFLPNHHTTPIVAVDCDLLKTPSESVRKKG